jgi:flagella basal body P-ring formation protein FlgA
MNLELRDHATLHGHKIFLKDLVSVKSQAELREHGLAHIPLGFAPPAGQARSINRSYVEGVLSREGLPISWRGAKSCIVSRRVQTVPSELLRFEIDNWLQLHAPGSGAYILEHVQASLPSNLPTGKLEFGIYSVATSLQPGRNILRVDAFVDSVKKRSFSVSINLVLEIKAARTRRNIKRGETIRKEDLSWETIRVDRRTSPLALPEQLVGSQARIMIPAGTVLDMRKIEKIPMVSRNQFVYVTAHNGGLSVRMQAKSVDRGGIGDVIRLKNMDSGKIFLATVSGLGEAELKL